MTPADVLQENTAASTQMVGRPDLSVCVRHEQNRQIGKALRESQGEKLISGLQSGLDIIEVHPLPRLGCCQI